MKAAKKVLVCSVILFCALLLVVKAEPAKQVIKIGVIVPLTGNSAFVGEDIRNGFTLAQEKIPTGNYEFKFIYEDSQLELRKAATVAQKLINVDKVDILLSIWETADVVAPLAEKAGIPHFCFRWDPKIAAEYAHTFTLESTYQTCTKCNVDMMGNLGVKRLALICEKNKASYLLRDELIRQLQGKKIELVAKEEITPGQRDFRSVLANTEAAKPDMYLVLAYQPMLEILLKQMRERKVTARITGNLELVENAALIEGCYYVDFMAATPEFQEEFKKRFGHAFKVRAPHAYDMFGLLAKAYGQLSSATKPSAQQLINAVLNIKNFSGALGPLKIGSERNIECSPALNQVVNGVPRRGLLCSDGVL